MDITHENIMLIVAVLLFLSVLVGKVGSKYGIPALLAFLGIGMLAGVDGFGLQFDNAAAAEFIGMISLCIILFSGGLDTDYKKIKPVLAPGLVLATVGVLVTTALTGVFIHEMMRLMLPELAFGWAESLLLAAIMSSTDSASVFSILNSSGIGLKYRLKPTLELESGSNDPMAYLLVILLISVIETGQGITTSMVLSSSIDLLVQLGVGTLSGVVLGLATAKVVNAINSDNEFLYPVMMIACCFFTFTLTGMVGGNSYLAVYVAGLVVGNKHIVLKRTIKTFFGGFTWLVQILMFLTLGLLVNPHELLHIAVPGILLALFMILLARPLAVFLCLSPFRRFTLRAKTYVSWVGLRGAVPIIFATYALMSPDVVHARFMFNLVFFITILSLLIQGTTVNTMAHWLGLTKELPTQHFHMELPDDVTAALDELTITKEHLTDGTRLREMHLPPHTLAILVKRNDEYIVPRGDTRLHIDDVLLLISRDNENQPTSQPSAPTP